MITLVKSWVLGLLVAVTGFALWGVALWGGFWWSVQDDPRQYPHGGLDVTIGGGSFEHDILPHYQLTLPCGARDVRYADNESLIGSDGTLYLTFNTSAGCLSQFTQQLCGSAHSVAGAALPIEFLRFPPWTFDPSRSYPTQGPCQLTDMVNISYVIDASTLYLIADHQ